MCTGNLHLHKICAPLTKGGHQLCTGRSRISATQGASEFHVLGQDFQTQKPKPAPVQNLCPPHQGGHQLCTSRMQIFLIRAPSDLQWLGNDFQTKKTKPAPVQNCCPPRQGGGTNYVHLYKIGAPLTKGGTNCAEGMPQGGGGGGELCTGYLAVLRFLNIC